MKKLLTIPSLCLIILLALSSQTILAGSANRPVTSAASAVSAEALLRSVGFDIKPFAAPSARGVAANPMNGGERFETATVVFDGSDFPYTDVGTTIGYVDDYDADCGGGSSTSPDAVYEVFLVDETTDFLEIEVCDADYDTKIMVYNYNSKLVACSEDFCGVDGYRSRVLLDVTEYNFSFIPFYVVVDGWGGESGNYTLNIDYAQSCGWSVPAGAVAENEACGVRENDGCNMVTPAFTDVANQDTISSNIWADTGSRDTDYYRLVLAAPDSVLVIASVPHGEVTVGLLESNNPGSGNCADLTGFLTPNIGINGDCTEDTLKLFLPAGTHYFWAGSRGFWGAPCVDNIYGYARTIPYWISFQVGIQTYYADVDGDGFGDPAIDTMEWGGPPPGYVADSNDCDDSDANIFPGNVEITCDGLDNDCDAGTLDEIDADGDGASACIDCDDSDATIYPGAPEILDDGIDQDCDGSDATCCGLYTTGQTGNADCSVDGKRNLADITRLIDRVYISKADLCCELNGNIDGDFAAKVNLADITTLIDHVYISKAETAPCE